MKHEEMEAKLAMAETISGHRFANRDLLKEAITHRSYANEAVDAIPDNDRLEFLGDAVLDLLIAEMLFAQNEYDSSGRMTKIRASLVNEADLGQIAQSLDLGEAILFGVGEERTGGKEKYSVLSDAYEALLGAVYLDGGLIAAQKMVERDFRPHFDSHIMKIDDLDAKSLLQEYCAKHHKANPSYRLLERQGPDHDCLFTVRCLIGKTECEKGIGRSIKAAEQEAAQTTLQTIMKKNRKDKIA